MSLLLRPFGVCAEFLNNSVMQGQLRPGMERAIKKVQGFEENDFKEKVDVKVDLTKINKEQFYAILNQFFHLIASLVFYFLL